MTLEDGVKVSQILMPVVIVWIGYFLSKSMNLHTQSLKILSDFNTRWSDEFISKCVRLNESISSIQHLIFELANTDGDQKKRVIIDKIEELIKIINRNKYEIEVHSALLDEDDDILSTVEAVFEATAKNVKELKKVGVATIDFQTTKLLQTKLNQQLKEMQKNV